MTTFQRPLFQPESTWRPPRLSDLPSWAGAKRIGIDLETRDEHLKKLGPGVRRGAYIVGYSFAIEDGPAFYVPLRHAGGDNVANPEAGIQYLQDQAKVFKGDLCGAHIGYDLDFMAEAGINWNVHRFRDCQIAEPLLDELQLKYSLEAIASRHGLPGKDETLLREAATAWYVDPKAEMWMLPARFIGPYATQDSRLPLQLLRRQEREIEAQELDVVYDLESRLLPVLIRMQRRGVRIDFKKLEEIEVWSETQEREQLDKVFELSRIRVQIGDVWKAEVLAHVLRKCEIEVPTKNGKSSVDQFLLGSIKHPVGALLLRARKVNKLRTTFAKSVREHAVNGRIHCTFNQLRKTDDSTDEDTGARYGRVSCTDPNLQQQPARDDFAEMWRSIYVADDGGLWAGADFSQQEPRWTVHFAELCGCEKASVAAQKYRDDPLTDNHTMMARLIWGYADNVEPPKQQRTYAKTIYLGLTYGMGGAKLAHRLGLPTKWKQIEENGVTKTIEVAGPEAQSILDHVNRQAPFLKKLATLCEKRAKYRGWIKTVMGRKCRFPLKKDGKGFDWTHKALNRLIQGSSADQTKKAMVDADEAGHPLQLQVHDELCETVCELKQAHELATIMRECLPARVPFRVDVETGPNWGESH